MRPFHLRWILKQLTENVRYIQMETRRDLLTILEVYEERKVRRFVTGDDSWFTLRFLCRENGAHSAARSLKMSRNKLGQKSSC
jgi:hypothetical protein